MTWPFPKEPRGHSLSSILVRHWATLGDLWFKLWKDNHNHNHNLNQGDKICQPIGLTPCHFVAPLVPPAPLFLPEKSLEQEFTSRVHHAEQNCYIFHISHMSRGNFKGCRRKNDKKKHTQLITTPSSLWLLTNWNMNSGNWYAGSKQYPKRCIFKRNQTNSRP